MFHARYGGWTKPSPTMSNAATVQPTNDLGFHCLLPLLAQAGRHPTTMTSGEARPGPIQSTTDPAVAERMALDCLLLPAPAGVVQRAVKMIDNNATTPSRPTRRIRQRAGGLSARTICRRRRASSKRRSDFLPTPTRQRKPGLSWPWPATNWAKPMTRRLSTKNSFGSRGGLE